MLKDAFSSMLSQVPHAQKGAFMVAFDEFLNNVFYGNLKNSEQANQPETPNFNPEASGQAEAPGTNSDFSANNITESKINQAPFSDAAENEAAGNSFPALYAKKPADEGGFPPPGMTQESLADGLRSFLLGKTTGMEAISTILANLADGDENMLGALRADLAKADSVTSLVNYLNDILKQLPDVAERQLLFEILSETVLELAQKGELPPNSPEDAQNTQNTPVPAGTQPESAEAAKSGTPPELSSLDLESAEFDADRELAQMPKPSSLEELTSFIQKNINHTALKTLDSYNASNLLQSLINAPGVYTPLSHFIVPLQIGDVKAFGELWVDNEDNSNGGNNGGKSGDKNYHLFLTFEIEGSGRFETDLYAHGSHISLAVLHPESFMGVMKGIKEKINRIIASTDYSVKEFQTGVLREPHDLTQIFPRIVEKRKGLDITV
jgi:hypothetical protein